MRRLLVLGLFAITVLASNAASAREEILSFVADITVETDGDLLVSETITVRAEGRQIKRGIFRDIPLRALDEYGFWSNNGFEVLDVEQDGAPAPYFTEILSRGQRIYIGDADTYLQPGVYTYRIRYRTTRQLRYFEAYDEIYWNATGSFWTFPIIEATARLHLPEGAVAEWVTAYTGGYGSVGVDYNVAGQGTSDMVFTTSRVLDAREGLTIAVGFTKGLVTENQTGELLAKIWDNIGAAIYFAGWLGVAFYFLTIWNRVGRDPPGDAVFPLFHPPENFSPATISWLYFQSFRQIKRGSSRAFIAALLSLGVKKHLRIDEDSDGDVTFNKLVDADAELSRGETALLNRIFSSSDSVKLNKSNGPKLMAAHSALKKAITGEYSGKFFNHNLGWFVIGVVLAIIVIVLSMVLQQPPDAGIISVFPPLILSGIGWTVAILGWRKFKSFYPTVGDRLIGGLFLVLGVLTILAALGISQVSDYFIYRIAGLIAFAGVGMISAFFWLLRAPTPSGAKTLSQIEGFMMYLATAESERLNLRDAPELTEDMFERYLPYAAGLGVEKPWSDAFTAHLARTVPEAQRSYQPNWYHGGSWRSMTVGDAMGGAMAAVSSSMATAMPAPKSSSGSGGGGSSGGGGGGGGGGGW